MPIASEAALCNIALGYAGVNTRINSLDEASAAARACKTYYEHYRDDLLNEQDWSFAVRRAELVPYTGTAFDSTHTYAAGDVVQYGSYIYRSLLDVNLAHTPPDNVAWWAQVTRDGWSTAAPLPADFLGPIEVYPKPSVSSTGIPGSSGAGSSFFRNPRSEERTPYAIEDANDGSGVQVLLSDLDHPVLRYKAQITNPRSFSTAFIKALAWRLSSPLSLAIRADPKAAQALEVKAEGETRKQVANDMRGQQQDPEPVSEFEAARER